MSFERIGRCVAVGYSGGRDSTSLLHATVATASRLGLEIVALHVHHGLSPFADAWEAHCRDTCRDWAASGAPLRFASARLAAAPARGDSVEAWARQGRYQRLAEMATEQGASVVLLAHHRRDQAETWLLQALRGAGPEGLSAMPAMRSGDGVRFLRPWLRRSADDVAAYAVRHGLRWVEDDSNVDPRYARNRLRLAVWPALASSFPSAETTLAQASEWSQQAAALMREVGATDMAAIAAERDGTGRPRLRVEAWAALSPARRANVLRVWWLHCSGEPATAQAVRRWMTELEGQGSARWSLPGGGATRHRGILAFMPHRELEPSSQDDMPFAIHEVGLHAASAWHGRLEVFPVDEGGVPLRLLADATLRRRGGGERFSFGPGRPARSLKKQYQALGIDAWSRTGPLVYVGERLLYVPGLGLEGAMLDEPGERRVGLRWRT